MNEQQVGLLLFTPVIVGFIAFMYWRGAMSRSGAIAAALASVVVAAWVFLSQ